MRRQNGFSLVEGLLIIIIVGIVGFAGYFVLNKNSDESKSTDSTLYPENQENSGTVGLKTYKDELAEYAVDYPDEWKISQSTEGSGMEDGSLVSTVVLTAETGLTLTLEHNYGGRGGSCEPNDTDAPHAPGNNCATSEIIYAEKTGNSVRSIDSNESPQSSDRFKTYDLNLVRTKYTNNGSTEYYSGLTADTPFFTVEVTDPEMGAYSPFSVISHYSAPDYSPPVSTGYYVDIKMSPHGNSVNFFNQTDVKQAEAILKSFRFLN